MTTALQNVVPSHLADPKQFDFKNLATQKTPFQDGDIGFDPIEFSTIKVTPIEPLEIQVPVTNINSATIL